MSSDERTELLIAIAEAGGAKDLDVDHLMAALAAEDSERLEALLANSELNEQALAELQKRLLTAHTELAKEHELPALIEALDGNFIAPVSGGDLIRNPEFCRRDGISTDLTPSGCQVLTPWSKAPSEPINRTTYD